MATIDPLQLKDAITLAANQYNVDPRFLENWASRESSFGQNASANVENKQGALGPFQFTRATAADYGLAPEDRTNPYLSAQAAAAKWSSDAKLFNNDPVLTALAIHQGRSGTYEAWQQSIKTGKPITDFIGPEGDKYYGKITGQSLASGVPTGMTSGDVQSAPLTPLEILTQMGHSVPDTQPQSTPQQGNDMADPYAQSKKYKTAALVTNAITDFGNNWVQSTQNRSSGYMALKEARLASQEMKARKVSTASTAKAKTAASGVDVSSVSAMDAQRNIAIRGGQAQAALIADGRNKKTAFNTTAQFNKVNAFMSLIGGALGVGNVYADQLFADQPTTLSEMSGASYRSTRGGKGILLNGGAQ